MNEEDDHKKDKIIGLLGMTGMAAFTIIGLIIKNIFFSG